MPRSQPQPPTPAVQRDGAGFTVDAHLLGDGFGLPAEQVPALLRSGAITSRCETGQDGDAGRYRLSFFHQSRALRLTIDAQGRILTRALFSAPNGGTGKLAAK